MGMPLPPLVAPVDALSNDELARTARHAVLAGIGDLGQRRLAAATVAVVGVGGLGSPVALALAAAGVKTIVAIDDDTVDRTNLQRQIAHRMADVGEPKVASVARLAADLSPETTVVGHRERLDGTNADRLLSGVDLVVDGTDSFASRTDVAEACERLGLPLVWGVIQEFHAQVTVFWSAPPAGVPPIRLADLYPPASVGEPPSCSEVGVLGALCVQVGGLMATEAIKLITGAGEPALGRVILIDALAGTQRSVPLVASVDPVEAGTVAGEPAAATAPLLPTSIAEIGLDELRAAQSDGATVLDVREPRETATGVLEGSVLVPLAELLADPGAFAATRTGPRATVVVVCERGARAQRAAWALDAVGMDASILRGGLAAWPR